MPGRSKTEAGRKQMSIRLLILSLVVAAASFFMPFSFHQVRGPLNPPQTIALSPPALAAQAPSVKPLHRPSTTAPGARVTASGIIRSRGFTTYMYGTHVLVDGNGHTLYALKSDHIDLGRYIGKEVTVSGELIRGYPLDGGPKYINVVAVSQ